MKKRFRSSLILAGCLVVFAVAAQSPADSLTLKKTLPEVVVSGLRDDSPRNNSLNINALRRADLDQAAAPTLALALTQLPGVSRLGTGQGIGKPVIRGLYGNRVLVLLGSLKMDNQQWQDEHGLGLSDIGVGRVEVIKGPAAVLFGSEAVGGVVNVIQERPDASLGRRQGDAGLRFFTNSAGLAADFGLSGFKTNGWWRVRAGAENHADYSEGGGKRALNSRFATYEVAATVARESEKRRTMVNFSSSLSNFGFVVEDLHDFFSPDRRWSRSYSPPHHTVALQVFSIEHNRFFNKNVLKINAGFQSNLRLEDEGGGAISLNMHLISLPWNVRFERPTRRGGEFIVSAIGSLERNTNYGARIIVPDANLAEQGISLFFRQKMGKIMLETGAGVADKFIQTFETRGLNTPDKALRPFRRNRASASGLAGAAWNPTEKWTLKMSAATGFRAPNLAELSSNGLHEGIFHSEIGRPDLAQEQNLNLEIEADFHGKWGTASAAIFQNQFRDFIFLAPTGEDFFGFPVFRFRQQNARLRGGECSISIQNRGWKWTNSLSSVRGEQAAGSFLPFMPAEKWVSRLSFESRFSEKISAAGAFVEGEKVFQQNRPAAYETPTPSYFLLHAGCSATVGKRQRLSLRINGRNLLDRRFFDHLSRFKMFGIYEPGRDLTVSARFRF